jgi:hypothetical protein
VGLIVTVLSDSNPQKFSPMGASGITRCASPSLDRARGFTTTIACGVNRLRCYDFMKTLPNPRSMRVCSYFRGGQRLTAGIPGYGPSKSVSGTLRHFSQFLALAGALKLFVERVGLSALPTVAYRGQVGRHAARQANEATPATLRVRADAPSGVRANSRAGTFSIEAPERKRAAEWPPFCPNQQ